MRPVLSAIVATALLTAAATDTLAQSQPCARGAEKAAFDLAGLKSELMVVAIACQAEDKYNAFVTRFRADLVSGEKGLTSYFARTSRGSVAKAHDDYITTLANAQSQQGIERGTLFCDEHMAMFDEVMARTDGRDLAGYAAGKSLIQPISLTECPASAAPAPKRAKVIKAASTTTAAATATVIPAK
jgi:hypothetical protein